MLLSAEKTVFHQWKSLAETMEYHIFSRQIISFNQVNHKLKPHLLPLLGVVVISDLPTWNCDLPMLNYDLLMLNYDLFLRISAAEIGRFK